MSTREGAFALAEQARGRFGQLNILVNNAGVTWGAPLEEFPASGWARAMNTNVQGVFDLTVALVPALRAAATAEDPARVINIGSIDGLRVPEFENYSYGKQAESAPAAHRTIDDVADRLLHADLTMLAKLSCAPRQSASRAARGSARSAILAGDVAGERGGRAGCVRGLRRA